MNWAPLPRGRPFAGRCGKRLPMGVGRCTQNPLARPARPTPETFETPTPGGLLPSLAHGVISWTLATKEDIMSKDDETLRRVLAGLQKGKAPTQAEREEARRRLELGKKQAQAQRDRVKRVKKLSNKKRGHGDGDVIDTGMFGS